MNTPSTEAKEAKVKKRIKAELSPKEAAEKNIWKSCRRNIMICLFSPFTLRKDLSLEEAVEKKRRR